MNDVKHMHAVTQNSVQIAIFKHPCRFYTYCIGSVPHFQGRKWSVLAILWTSILLFCKSFSWLRAVWRRWKRGTPHSMMNDQCALSSLSINTSVQNFSIISFVYFPPANRIAASMLSSGHQTHFKLGVFSAYVTCRLTIRIQVILHNIYVKRENA